MVSLRALEDEAAASARLAKWTHTSKPIRRGRRRRPSRECLGQEVLRLGRVRQNQPTRRTGARERRTCTCERCRSKQAHPRRRRRCEGSAPAGSTRSCVSAGQAVVAHLSRTLRQGKSGASNTPSRTRVAARPAKFVTSPCAGELRAVRRRTMQIMQIDHRKIVTALKAQPRTRRLKRT